jgi:hypothetical protein
MKLIHALVVAFALSGAVLAQTNPVPLIYQPLLPTTAQPGSSKFTLTVNGTGFGSGALVTWNGKTRVTSYISSSQIQAQITADDVAKAGTASINVLNPKPGGGISNTIFFPIQTPAPVAAVAKVPGFFNKSGVSVAADFNNDGFLDLVVGAQNNDGFFVDAYYGNGDGTFQKVFPNHAVLPSYLMIAGDFNKTQFLDIADLDGIGNTAILSNYSGSFFLPHYAFRSTSPSKNSPSGGLATADFNADGKLDLVAAGYKGIGPANADVYLGNGDGTFGSALHLVKAYTDMLGNPAVGDFNGDGKLDLALPTGAVAVFLGNGDGTFQTAQAYDTAYPATAASVADVNGDGKLDIVTDGGVLLGNGDGTFSTGAGFNVCSNGCPISNPLLGDFNGDGKLDVVIGFWLLLGNGDGTFQTPIRLATDSASTVVMGDFNGDGKLDLVGTVLYLQVPMILNPASLGFGNQKVGTKSKPQEVTALNDGASPLSIEAVNIAGKNPNDFSQSNNCPTSLPVGSKCKITVVFEPTAGGPREATLQVNYKGVGSPQTVALKGTGAVSTVTLKPSKLEFALQLVGTHSSPQTATLTNTGTVQVNISNITTSGPFNQNNNCPSSLPVNSSCQINVTFSPVGPGHASGKLSVTDDAEGSPQMVALSGIGTVVTISPLSINFGNQKVGTHGSPAPVKVKNVGKNAIKIDQITFEGEDPGDFSQTSNCGHSLGGGKSCTIRVTFTPQGKGNRSASLEVFDNGGGSPQTVALTGTGT